MSYEPVYALRSYGGGAVVAQLVNSMGPTDTQFIITPTTDWVENDGSPLGTSGTFIVVVDRFTDEIEKIECSSINLSTGVVNVYINGGYTGRGFDGTTAQQHDPDGSTSGVQTGWSSVEAMEANTAVATLFGTTGPTPETGYVLTWVNGAPEYVGAVASGELYSTSTATIAQTTWSDVPMTTAVNLSGGMTQSGNNLVVPVAGKYLVCGQAGISVATGAAGFQAGLFSSVASTQRLYGSSGTTSTADDPANLGSTFSKVIVCAANEQLKLQVIQTSNPTSGWPLYFVANEVTNWLTVTFVSL